MANDFVVGTKLKSIPMRGSEVGEAPTTVKIIGKFKKT